MSLETDLLLDRRRLKRRLNLWRVLAIGAAALFLLVLVGRAAGTAGLSLGSHITRVTVSGIMTEDHKLLEAVDAMATDSSVVAVIVSIDSPGGTVSAGESLYNSLSRVAAAKPVVAVMNGTAASAGFMIAMPAARVYARGSTLTGSIGVILETFEASGLLGHVGVGAEAITSGPLKDQPSFTHPLSPEGRDYLHALVSDMFDQFVAKVASGRHLDDARVRELADGRAYTGNQALKLGLVDELGGEREARSWLEKERHIAAGTPVEDLRLGSVFDRTVGASLSGLVPSWLTQSPVRPGAWAIWQGAVAN